MAKFLNKIELPCTDLHASRCSRDSEHPEGVWLYDDDAGMNLAMGAKDEVHALVEAVHWWKKRAKQYEKDYRALRKTAEDFANIILPRDEEES